VETDAMRERQQIVLVWRSTRATPCGRDLARRRPEVLHAIRFGGSSSRAAACFFPSGNGARSGRVPEPEDPVFGTAELTAAKSAFGLGGDVEFRLARFFSFDVGLGYSKTSVEFSHTVGAGVQEDKLGMMPLFLGANLHVVTTKRVMCTWATWRPTCSI